MSGPEDPPRWAQSGEAPPDFDALRRADDARVPDALQLNRMLQGIAARVGQPELGQPAPAAPSPAPPSGVGLGVKLLAGLLAAAAFVGLTVWLGTPSKSALSAVPSDTTDQAPPPIADTLAHEPPVAPVVPEAEPTRAAEEPPRVVERSVQRANGERVRELVVAAPPKLDAAAEIALLERAQHALKTDPRVALALAEQHKQRFEDGALAQEREMLAIEALIALDKKPAAERRAHAFESAFPHSTHLPRLSDLLRSNP